MEVQAKKKKNDAQGTTWAKTMIAKQRQIYLIVIIAMTERMAYSLFNRRIGALLAIFCSAYWIVAIDCLSLVTPSSTKSPIKEQHQGGSNSNEDNFRNNVNNQRRQLQNRPDGNFVDTSTADNSPSDQLRRSILSRTLPTIFASSVLGLMIPLHDDSANAAGPLTPDKLVTVVLDSPENKIGVQLADTTIQLKEELLSAVVVKSLNPNGQAAADGVQVGMVLSTKSKFAADIITKIKQGPYPMAFQFYSLSDDIDTTMTPLQALEQAQASAAAAATSKPAKDSQRGPPVSSKGAGLGVKTVVGTKPNRSCIGAKRGDAVTIRYEARVASPGGPIYDGTEFLRGNKPTTFVLGDSKAINGVDIGLSGMCVGEIRELDIPAGLGYGRYGSDLFDIPGDVRLWWKIELLDIEEGATGRKNYYR